METLDEKMVEYKKEKLANSHVNYDRDKITIDIFNTVFNLRKQRCQMVKLAVLLLSSVSYIFNISFIFHMLKCAKKLFLLSLLQVQSAAQYEFLHRCIVDYAKEIQLIAGADAGQSTPMLR